MKSRIRILTIIISLLLVFLITGCVDITTQTTSSTTTRKGGGTTEEIIDDEYSSILSDRKFKRGFVVRGLGLPIYKDHADEETYGPLYDTGYVFQYGKKDLDKPVWEICQWSSRYAFHDESVTTFTANGTEYTYRNPSKFLRVNTSTGEFTLGLDAEQCYVYGDRELYMEWPHLLISRDINKSALTKLSDKSELRIIVDASLDRYEDKMRVEPVSYIHAAQCMFYLYISNYDKETDNFSDMLWLGMTLFDSRTEFTEEFARPDTESKESATGNFIYNVASTEYLNENNNFYKNGKVVVGSSVSINFDILPFVRLALEKAQEQDCMLTSSYDNLYVTGMYIGFELPGTYNIEMTFNNMDIKVK